MMRRKQINWHDALLGLMNEGGMTTDAAARFWRGCLDSWQLLGETKMATKRVKSKYPQDLFVEIEKDGADSYFVAGTPIPEAVAAVGSTVRVAHYVYMGMFEVSTKVDTKSV